MPGPGWLTGLLAAVMLTVAAYNATRLVAAPRRGRAAELDADGAHVVMGVAMAGMLTPALSFAPPRLWQAFFAASGVWFGYQCLRTRRGQALGTWRCPHPLPHLIECAAMILMLALPATTATGMAAMTSPLTGPAARFSPLTLLLVLFMVGYVMWLANNLSALTPAPAIATATATGTTTTGTTTTGTTTTGTTTPAAPYLAPRCAACCKIAMAVTMGYMLVVML